MEPRAVHYAKLHRRFLEEDRPDVLAKIKAEGDLTSYLSLVGNQADDRYLSLLAQLGNDPEVQNLPFQEKAARLRSHPEIANEIVLHDLVHQPLAEDSHYTKGAPVINDKATTQPTSTQTGRAVSSPSPMAPTPGSPKPYDWEEQVARYDRQALQKVAAEKASPKA